MREKILIVDDNKKARDILRDLFEQLDLQVIGEAEDGVEALEKAEGADLISLDIIMPNMDGIECYRHLKKQFPKKKVFFISHLAKEPSIKTAYSEEIPSELFFAKYPAAESLEKFLHPENTKEIVTPTPDSPTQSA